MRNARCEINSGFSVKNGYDIEVVGKTKATIARTTRSLFAYPVHELIDEDTRTDANMLNELKERVDNRKLPEKYFKHPIVQAHPAEYVLPLAIFCDAVPYSLTDGCIGFWVVNLITGMRYLGVASPTAICVISTTRSSYSAIVLWTRR